MQRRAFIRLTGGAMAVGVPLMSTGCAEEKLEALKAWEGPPEEIQNDDVRLRVLAYAILAPSAHNKQPWRVDLKGSGITLYIDSNRLLPQIDPTAREMFVSQGTFLEVLSVAASHYGFRAQIVLFPDGEIEPHNVGKNPVSQIELVKEESTGEDELFGYVTVRHTNRREYEAPSLTEEELSALRHSYADEGYPLQFITEASARTQIAEMATEAMRIQTYNTSMHAETVEMIRFSDEEIERRRDGFGFQQMGMSGITLVLAQTFTGRSSAFGDFFLEQTVKGTSQAASSARAFGLITSKGATRTDEVMAGRYFARLHLAATKLGLSLQPMSQILEIESAKQEFLKKFPSNGEEPQMLFRLGRSRPTPHSPRRPLLDFTKT